MNKDGYVKAGGHRLYYQYLNLQYSTRGKPFLIFLHEGLGSIPQWKEFPDLLSHAVKLPVFLYERYGFGNSDPLMEAREIDFLHKEALEVLPEILMKLKIPQPYIFFGHSDGATIALIYASSFGNTLSAIITEAPHVVIEDISMDGLKNAIQSYESGDMKEKLMKYHKDHTDKTFYGWADIWLSEAAKRWHITDLLPKIKTPLFFIQGADDEYGSTKQLTAISQNITARVASWILPDCGHIPHLQFKEEVLEKVSNFITGIIGEKDR